MFAYLAQCTIFLAGGYRICSLALLLLWFSVLGSWFLLPPILLGMRLAARGIPAIGGDGTLTAVEFANP
jgi:hypothetical protein